jgi:serine acetyltransferase
MDSSLPSAIPGRDAQRLTWAQTRTNIRRDYARLLGAMEENASLPKKIFWFFLPTFFGLFIHRLSRHAYVNGWRNLGRFLYLVNNYLTRLDIPPTTSIGPGCLLGHTPVTLCGRIGENYTLMGDGGIGGGFDSQDIGGGPGLPVVGDDVVMAFRAIVLGAVHVGDGARLGPSTTVMRDVPAGGVVAAPTSRITRGTGDVPAARDAAE